MTRANTYHHGDLRAALLSAARTEIERTRYEDLSLRSLATAAGVSHGAPYRHFESREALLIEIAAEEGRRLGALYEAISRRPVQPQVQLKEMCKAYVALAAEHPQLFRLMFVSEIVQPKRSVLGSWWNFMHHSYELFSAAVAAVLKKTDPALVDQVTLATWSTIHGLAILRMTGHVGLFASGVKDEEALLDSVLERTVRIKP